MAKTFMQMVGEARQEVPALSPAEVQSRMQQDPQTLMIDVREPDALASTGVIHGAKNVPLGMLAIKADQELPAEVRDEQLQDRSQPVIVTCQRGGQAALGAKTLKDMGFTNVSFVEGGTEGWKEAGLPTEQPK
ncbi:MAG: Rhodanese-like domain protein [uncultured Thermomicrobiales bacterium]|uniref:Rhodanese-like domain protein n=1 Tax=uncultured Thermomicrobiales bacterium TaxID=1645740 RepID=A0A6J4V3Q7_9BACT|nr:MAG: Rhodanese-like domain protein [uncultured Thermomicrobiales bacterium]